MPRSAAASVENKFTAGLVTEATGLNFPENAVTETYNCVFDEKGIVRRRLGIDFETDFEEQTVDRDGNVVTNFYWKAAAGNGDNALAVIQVGETLYFYLVEDTALSANMIDTLDLSVFEPAGAPSAETIECQFASGNGYLFVSHPTLEPFYVTYDPDTTSVTATAIAVNIRDFEGVEDGLDIDERPAVLSDEHEYNLINQGWFVDDINLAGGGRGNVITFWDSQRTDFPANNDIWYTHLRAQSGGSIPEVFDPGNVGNEKGNSPATKGHIILGAFFQDRSAVSGVPNLAVVSSGFYRPSTIEFFAGRVWYSGTNGQEFSNKVYFSQIIERKSQFGQCYQFNDPTDRDNFDLLPSDGGVITIPDSGTIIKLFAIESSILVFATNGVWGITGSEGIGFKATDYSIRKLSSISALTASSFVSITGFPAWWNEEGIYVANVDEGGSLQVKPLTDGTIKSFFDDIPVDSKRFAHGYFNTRTRVVHWVYRTTAGANLTESYEFDAVLNYNVLTNAFYPWLIDNSPVSVNGIIVVEGQSSITSLETVTDNSLATVTNNALATVEALVVETVSLSAVTKFISSFDDTINYTLTFAEEIRDSYLDWESFDDVGVDYSSYFTSGYKVHGEAQRKFQPTLLFFYTKKLLNPSVLDFRTQWNYATSGDTGKWSSTQRLIYPDDDYEYQWKRIKVRGHGLALQYRIDSVTGEPFNIIGWSAYETGNQLP